MLIIMGVPFAAFASWSHLNRYTRSGTHIRIRKTGITLADFAAPVAMLHLAECRHFIPEHQACSERIESQPFSKFWRIGEACSVNVPQCALGFVVLGEPIYKNTTLWASDTLLLEPLRGAQWRCNWHGASDGSNNTNVAHVWPYEVCARIVCGCQALIRHFIEIRSHLVRKYPSSVEVTCPACRRGVVMEHS